MINLLDENTIGFGIAGNFANHLEQAGEGDDFVDVKVDEESAPKGIFPTYSKNSKTFLNVFPFSGDSIANKNVNMQMEPEVGLYCSIKYKDNEIVDITPEYFMAYNDCSLRVKGADKISQKKNWGANSKGISKTWLCVDQFEDGGLMDEYSLVSFIKRDEELIQYGENSELLGYSYFYTKLKDWIINKLNTQEDFGPLENIQELIKTNNKPKNCIISIGATRYTEFGESNYLKIDDEIYVVLYNHNSYSQDDIEDMIENNEYSEDTSVLHQKVI
ncbi:MAG: Unknown protein [uncultured Campylobacterales bacterium]|uniref:Uncharacterized protein n=1 Tax=uncultured Campylobacterales bacterium TaxID=352960 RepID=A0A6S6RYU4_9BACT|nr:MAG: Unknown protein [uncultured Campylobacterales bacterium]